MNKLKKVKYKKLNIHVANATPKKEMGFRIYTPYIRKRVKELEDYRKRLQNLK